MDPIILEPDGLCHAEARALIEAAQRVVQLCDNYLTIYDGRPQLRDAIGHLRLTLRHVTPADEPEPDDENKPAPLPWWTPEDVRAKIEG